MIKYSTFELENGLRVIHTEDRSTPMVAVNLLYKVGARDDPAGHRGMAHLFEHLMFGGSENLPDFSHAIEMAGGTDNAWTSNDYTSFYELLPAANIETALWAESDRMERALLSKRVLDIQKSVVIEEFKQTLLNQPYGDLSSLIRGLVYTVHPYKNVTIGHTISEIESICEEDVRRFYDMHYGPDNALLGIAGNITLERTKQLVYKWFGGLQPRGATRCVSPREPQQTHPRRLEVERPVSGSVIMLAFPMCGYGGTKYESADILTDILSVGTSSRLYRELVMGDDTVNEADACILGSEEPGYLTVSVRPSDNTDGTLAAAETAVWRQIDKIVSNGVTDWELTRALNKYATTWEYGLLGCLNSVQALVNAAVHNEDINSNVPRYRRLTVDDINAAAREILRPEQCNTLIYRPLKS